MMAPLPPAWLKVELAVQGLRVDAGAQRALFRGGLPTDHVLRSLDLVLPARVLVAAPIEASSASTSPFRLTTEGSRFFVVRENGGPAGAGAPVEVRPVPPPLFYERKTERGVPMWRIATVHGSHLLVTPGGACGVSVRGRPCRFCVEGARTTTEREQAASIPDVLEVVGAAFAEGVADFVYFNTAVFDAEDGGIAFLEPYVRAVRRHFDTLVAAQVHPPRTDRWIDRTYAMGVDAISYNLEVFDTEALDRHAIGRARFIGRERYLEALAHAALVFPRGTVWSDLVAGPESPASTIAGIDALCRLGVVPVVVVQPPVAELERPPVNAEALVPVLEHLSGAARQHGVAAGWVRDLAVGITPYEARAATRESPRLAVAAHTIARSRLVALAARSLARLRRRLRVNTVSDSFDSAQL